MKKLFGMMAAFAAVLLVGCSKEPAVDPDVPYITFEADAGQVFSMDFQPRLSYEEFTLEEGDYFEYSVGGGEWKRFTTTVSGIAFGGDKGNLRLRGKSRKGTSDDLNCVVILFFESAYVRCNGDIRTLVDYEDYKNADTKNATFKFLFNGCTVLTTAPALPATALAADCYSGMFSFCTSLRNAPALPATTLAPYCYYGMFRGCTSLENAPTLPATKLDLSCYGDMFNFCTSLKNAPALPATALADDCYSSMFNGCTSLENAPALPATTLEKRCYDSMFAGCNSLESAPDLPATTLVSGCYYAMFSCCTSLKEVKLHAADGFMSDSCLYFFLYDVPGPGIIYLKDADVEEQFKFACYEVYENWEIKYFSE